MEDTEGRIRSFLRKRAGSNGSTEERVAAVMLIARLVENRSEDADEQALSALVRYVVNKVKVPFLLRMVQTKRGELSLAMPIHRSALSLLVAYCTLPSQDIGGFESYVDKLLSICFEKASGVVIPRESFESVLLILKAIVIGFVNRGEEENSKVLIHKILKNSIDFKTAHSSLVLACICDIYTCQRQEQKPKDKDSSFSSSKTSNRERAFPSQSQSLSGEALERISSETASFLRSLAMQGLHGYASDDVRTSTLQSIRSLLAESILAMRPYSAIDLSKIETETRPSSLSLILVPPMWSIEREEGQAPLPENSPQADGEQGGDNMNTLVSDILKMGLTSTNNNDKDKDKNKEKSASVEANKKGKYKKSDNKDNKDNKADLAPVGQFALLVCSIVRVELRLLCQQVLGYAGEEAAPSAVGDDPPTTATNSNASNASKDFVNQRGPDGWKKGKKGIDEFEAALQGYGEGEGEEGDSDDNGDNGGANGNTSTGSDLHPDPRNSKKIAKLAQDMHMKINMKTKAANSMSSMNSMKLNTQQSLDLALSIFDCVLSLLVGSDDSEINNSNNNDNNDDDEDEKMPESAIWSHLPLPALFRIRRNIHGIIGDLLEFLRECGTFIHANCVSVGTSSVGGYTEAEMATSK